MKLGILIRITMVAGSLLAAAATQAGNPQNERKTMAVTHLTRDDFRTKIYDFERNPGSWKFEGDKPALVDFYASWCGPCKMLAPIIEELGEEYAGRVDIYKVDVDEQQELAALFGVRSIPTLLFIPLEGDPQMAVGAMPKATLKANIDRILLGK